MKSVNRTEYLEDEVMELESADLEPDYGAPPYEDTAALKARPFAALQLRARQAAGALLHQTGRRVLVLCGSAQMNLLKIAQDLILLEGARPVSALAPDAATLFGTDGRSGLLREGTCLIMPCAYLLDHPKRLLRIEERLERGAAARLVLYGDALDCTQLQSTWPYLERALYADLVGEFPASRGYEIVGGLVAACREAGLCRDLEAAAVALLCRQFSRDGGDRRWLSLTDSRLESLVVEAGAHAQSGLISCREVLRALAAADFRLNYLAEAQLRDHRDGQILMCTRGQAVGQINGLSVIETAGTSYVYGEPVRITATLRAGGEGDVIDIERKAELAGQIHAKAMMIINGFLTREFASEQPLPVSASVVFEQSYSSIDGDSASLTGLCAVLSCLADLPLRQDLAVTGAVDQFGDVQPVGGVNEKIEGFFRVCRLQGLTGTQGVIIPLSCVPQLVLRGRVLKAIAQGMFHIYTVSHVSGALKLLTAVDWGDEHQPDSVSSRIFARLNAISNNAERPWWRFWG